VVGFDIGCHEAIVSYHNYEGVMSVLFTPLSSKVLPKSLYL